MKGRQFRGMLAQKDITVEELAARMRISYTSLNDRIRGRSRWTWEEVKNACEVLHLDYADFALYF